MQRNVLLFFLCGYDRMKSAKGGRENETKHRVSDSVLYSGDGRMYSHHRRYGTHGDTDSLDDRSADRSTGKFDNTDTDRDTGADGYANADRHTGTDGDCY